MRNVKSHLFRDIMEVIKNKRSGFMRRVGYSLSFSFCLLSAFTLCSCSSMSSDMSSSETEGSYRSASYVPADYTSRIPQHIASNEKTVVVNPNAHVWGAYEGG